MMKLKKVLMPLFVVLIAQFAVASDVDLYKGLLFWIKDQKNIEGNEPRQTSVPLSTVLDGSQAITFSGIGIPKRDTSAFSFAISFKVGSLNCINRLFQLGRSSRHFYLDAANTLHYDVANYPRTVNWKAEKANTWYTIVVSHEAGKNSAGMLKIYAGTKDSKLVKVNSQSEGAFFDCTTVPGMGYSFKLGQTDFPSSGYLTSGQFANVRFWTRALTDEECVMADKSQNAAMSADDVPVGAPNGSIWDFFPLDGNAYRTKSTSMAALAQNTSLSNWMDSADRFSIGNSAVVSTGSGKVTISSFETLFSGSYTLNNGKTLNGSNYDYRKQIQYDYDYYPHPAVAKSGSENDATYSVWIQVNQLPTTGSVKLFERSVDDTDASGKEVEPQKSNKTFSLSLTNAGKLTLAGSGLTTTTFARVVSAGDWHLITIVGKASSSVQIFLDGVEIGNVASSMVLGYLPPIDRRHWYHSSGQYYTDGSLLGSVEPCAATFILGGWSGAADGLTFFHSALTAAQVSQLYEMGRHPDPNTVITPTTRNFVAEGGGGAIITSGDNTTWYARVTEPWITLSSNNGNIGYPVAYTVSATTNAEQRIGYVYVNGHAHEVTQDGVGGTINSDDATFEKAGGSGTIAVGVQNGIAWKATSNVDWLSVSPTNGIGSGSVSYQVSAYNDVATRQGTLTIAGNTFTVFQYGRRIKLEPSSTTQTYETHVIPITVNALAITQWSVAPNNSWISVVDAGNGQGGDLVTIAIAENPSYKARTGTVTIGTETFTVTQQGRPAAALSFSVSPTASTASVEGANGLVSVTATPDLPWTATSGANWLTVYAATATGAGNGNVVYVASPNPTLSQRTGTITVTPEAASGMTAKTHKVTQPAAQSALSFNSYEFEAAGESCSVDVSVASIVEWSISESLDWITVNGSTSRTGPGTVTLQASANNTVYPRSGTVTIAGKTFSVSQKARGVELEYDTKLFGTDGGYESISIHPDGNSAWTAVASDATWITIFQGDSGTGDGEILYIVSPYVGDGSARTGWITVGDKKVYITQRAYDLSIEPNGTNVVGNAGAGEFGVSASIGDVWTAIVTEPWITLVSGYDAGTGSGTVRFLYTENTTGKTRTGKIIVAGEVYTLEQRARQMVAITATAEHGGHVSGGGSYDLGEQVTLTAVPDSGYAFSYWTGAISSMQNPLTVTADVAKSYTAVFTPMPIAFTSVVSDTNGVLLSWNNLAWAATYRIYRGETSVPGSAMVLAELPNDGSCTYLDESGDVDTTYWYWIEAEGASDEVMSDPMTGKKEKPVVISPITYTNLRGATNPNPATYREGTLLTFENPGTVTGYTFAGWTPSQITTDMTGAQTISAAWTANSYSITYNPNGGSGTMNATAMTYDAEGLVASNDFIWAGHVFTGWATNETGEAVYAAGQMVSNLTAQSSGVVTLYAVWEDLVVAAPVVSPADGAVFAEDSCTVTLSCATEGAVIYYSPKGATPKISSGYLYTGPFTITDTATIKAIAVLEGVRSEYVTATITKRTLSLADALGTDSSVTVTTGGDAAWMPVADVTATGGLSARSGSIGDEDRTWLQVAVSGAGTLAFRCKTSCEHDDDGTCTWDHLEIWVDDMERTDWRIDSETGWIASRSITFETAGTHTVRWVYRKDESDAEGEDCAWVDAVTWTPAGGNVETVVDVGGGKSVTVPGTWLAEHSALVEAAGGDASVALAATAANGRKVWECYALGLNPEDSSATNDFRITSFPLKADGTPDIEHIVFDPPQAKWNVPATYKVKGAANLSGPWQEVDGGLGETALPEGFRFFKVEVVLP